MVFEDDPPRRYPELALAGVSNHDLPTLPGLWAGSDVADQVSAGVTPNRGFASDARRRVTAVAGVDPSAATGDAVVAVYRALAQAPSLLIAATLDDALEVEERPNIPGSDDERANWSLALPKPLEEIERHPGPRALGRLLARRP
jgi:4-alpha-glucanotransferase